VTRAWRTIALIGAGHAALVLALCADAVLLGRVPYVRDVSVIYVPDLAFLSRALAEGVWPLWNPLIDGGRRTLFAYVPDVVLAALLGPIGAARAEVPLHLWWAAAGASMLAHVRGRRAPAAWATGAFYAASGYVLSCGNVFPLLQAAAWAPWVIAASLRACERPGSRWVLALAMLASAQVGSLSAELILQTGFLVLLLAPRPSVPGQWRRLALAGLLAAALSAPVLLGALAMASDSARAAGFGPGVALSWSLHPAELPGLALPRYFGDMHTFSDVGYWGQSLFHKGYPYFLSLYLGPIVLLLAALGRSLRLGLIAAAGALIALGAHGPLAPLVAAALGALHARVPSKFLLMTVIAVALMAGDGLDKAAGRRRWWVLAPGLAMTMAGAALLAWPEAVGARPSPSFPDDRALVVMQNLWPSAFLLSGLLALVAGAALHLGGRMTVLAAVAGVADLVVTGASLNPTAPPSFYELRAPLRALVEEARSEGPFRWFSYGAASSPLTWSPEVVARNRDRPLFEIEVQSLLPRTQELIGLEGAFDEDRTGFAPRGSVLTISERRPARFRDVLPRLRLANVRWVLGYEPLPEDLVRLRGAVAQPEVREPLLLFELRDPLPRAFWVPAETADGRTLTPPPARGGATVSYERIDPHTVALRSSTPPGFIVVLDGYDPGWRARDEGGLIPLARAYGRYWRIPTAGGVRSIVVRFEPAWRAPALLLAVIGLATMAVLALRDRRRARV
jgi:hypothetical protein